LTEAAACARPLITTNVPGCRDVVTDEVDGLLIPPRDSVALARAVERLKADRCLAKRLGEAARKKALDKFDENIIIEQTLNVYKELQGQII
jgi:glycosyltransferase involved in cell wall biosynthesis